MILIIVSLIIMVTSQCTLGLTNHDQGARPPQQEVQVSLPKDFQVKKENIFFFPNMNRIIVDVRPYDPLADPLNPINGKSLTKLTIRFTDCIIRWRCYWRTNQNTTIASKCEKIHEFTRYDFSEKKVFDQLEIRSKNRTKRYHRLIDFSIISFDVI